MIVSIIVAMDQRGGIGFDNHLPWYLPDDLKRFKRLTMGHYLIMGRKTYESIGKPLPGRKLIVLSSSGDLGDKNGSVLVKQSMEDAIEFAAKEGEQEVFIAGGSRTFKEALKVATRMYITLVYAIVKADVFFPSWNKEEWVEIQKEYHPIDERHCYPFNFFVLEKLYK